MGYTLVFSMNGYLLKYLFQAPEKAVKIQERRFNCPDKDVQQHLEKIGLSFLTGYNTFLTNPTEEAIIPVLKKVDPKFSGFAYEGFGMGLEILDHLPFNNKNRLNSFLKDQDDSHTYIMHVGAGWALAKLPVSIEKAIRKFDPLLRWLVIDGYGFHQAYFHTKKYVHQLRKPKRLSPFAKHVFYQGIGRCLWFTEGAQPDEIAFRISTFPEEYHGDLWAGVGLACAYAGGVSQERVSQLVERCGIHRLELAQGVCFAAQARHRAGIGTAYTEMACQVVCGISAEAAAAITQASLPDVSRLTSEEAYSIWRATIREAVKTYQSKSLPV